MIASDRSLLDLDIKTSANDDDTLVSVISGQASRVKFGLLSDLLSQWDNINNKPFNSINSSDFSISTDSLSGSKTLGISSSIKSNSHNHTNKRYLDKISESNDGTFLYNNTPVTAVSEWNTILKKPFNSVSEDDFTVDENNMISIADAIKSQLHTHTNSDVLDKFSVSNEGKLLYDGSEIVSDSIDFTSLSNMLVQGDNITISTDEVAQTITFSASGMDFTALSNALTMGTQNGISITADTDNNVFNFEVTGVPSLEIDSEGYWTINGERGENPTKAQGENGANGITPHIDNGSGNWFFNEEDTGVKARGDDGYSPSISLVNTDTGVEINITNKDNTQRAIVMNGEDGKDGITTIQTSKVDKTCTFLATGWSSTVPYTQTVAVEGITESLNPRIDIIISDNVVTGKKEEIAFSYVTKVTTGDGILTAYCYETKPDVDLNIMIEVI